MHREIAVLYRLDFPNGKSYIGITSLSMNARMRCHRASKKGILRHALKKYEKPIITLLVRGERTYISALESRAILCFGTLAPRGYNLTKGGDGFSSAAMRAMWRDPAFRLKTVAAMRNGKPRGDNYNNILEFRVDPKRVKLWRERMSTSRRRYWSDPANRARHGQKVRETIRRKKQNAKS